MERRLVFAILLMILVAVVPSLFLKPPRRPVTVADSTLTQAAPRDTVRAPAATRPVERRAIPPAQPRPAAAPAETVTVVSPLARYTLSSAGATLESAEL